MSTVAAAATPPTLTKAFGAASIAIGQPTSLTFTLTNPNAGSTLTGVSFVDQLPSGLVLTTPNGLANNCGGNVFAPAGSNFLSIDTVTLAPGATCTWSVNVIATTAGVKDNVTGQPSATESGSGATASATVTVPLPAAPALTKAFGASSIAVGQPTSLSFTVTNPNATFTTLTNVSFVDQLPTGLLLATPNGLANSCGGNVFAPAGSNFMSIDTVTLAPGASCTWSANVIATTAGVKDNVTSATSSTESAAGATASATVTVPLPAAPALTKAFGASSIAIGQPTSLTFTITNPNATFTTLTNVSFVDQLPSGLVVATPNGLANSCGGNVFAPAATNFVSIDTVTLAPGASCTWRVNVIATTSGTKNNVTGPISATESGSGATASASVTVPLPAAPALTKAFGASSIAIGQPTSLTFTITNPNATFTTLTNVGFVDQLPSGMVVATPNALANNCGGNVFAPAATNFVSIDTVTLAPGASCTWRVNVIATTSGTKNNVTGPISATESGSGATASASVTVPLPAAPALTKAFGASSIAIGQPTSLTFTITNPNATFTTLTNVGFVDQLPSGMVVTTPNALANNCGGNVFAPAATNFVSIDTVTLAPGASCTWSVNVIGTTAGTKNNVTGPISATESAGGGATASATVVVLGPPTLSGAGSRRIHGAAGTFDLPLLLTPNSPTTEPRVGPTQTIVLSFDKPIASADNPTISEGSATFSTISISGNDVVVTLTGVTDMQYVTIAIANVASTDGGAGGSASVRIGYLMGDVNQNRVVTVSDLGVVNAQLAQPATASNFLRDINASGSISVADRGSPTPI